jgi:hypothetical protein
VFGFNVNEWLGFSGMLEPFFGYNPLEAMFGGVARAAGGAPVPSYGYAGIGGLQAVGIANVAKAYARAGIAGAVPTSAPPAFSSVGASGKTYLIMPAMGTYIITPMPSTIQAGAAGPAVAAALSAGGFHL